MNARGLQSMASTNPRTVGSRAVRVFALLLACIAVADSVIADDRDGDNNATETDPQVIAEREQARATAVALNYCRTSFHRIRRYPSKRVLIEEQQQILNNLDLNGIADEEVVRLYTAVLQEISQVQIAARERKVIKERHRRVFYRQLSLTALELTAQLATAHYASAVRTGASSWWDFRAMGWQTELDSWKLEKQQIVALTDKSALFLDTFWKLARKRNIPDRWLVRSTDLDRLEEAIREPDLAVRLRVLKRMENFMECYPPYWYYVGRTEQQLGQLFAAAETYRELTELGRGHFRKDEMLAAGTVNRAVIQQYLKQPAAEKTALDALKFSMDGWEVNLMGADVLRRNGQFEKAEDAILRNLDVELERPQSLAALLMVYYDWKNKEKLAARLASLEVLRDVPMPTLLHAARLLANDRLPAPFVSHLRGSLGGQIGLNFGRDDLLFSALPVWQLESARISVIAGRQTFTRPTQSNVRDRREVRFRRVLELGSPLKPSTETPPLLMVLDYPDGQNIRVHLHDTTTDPGARSTYRFLISHIEIGETTLRIVPLARSTELPPPLIEAPKPDAAPEPKSPPPAVPEVETLPAPPGS
jgi:tetratricopeptide (TPR) repeat protein